MSKQKKILIVGPAWPLRGGLATYNERLCRELNQMGHSAEILSFSLQYPKLLFPGKTQISSDPKPDNLTIHSFINSINPINWIKTGRYVAKRNYDIVVFRYWLSFMAPAFGTIARIIKRNNNTRILAITDNIVPHEKRFFDSLFTKYFLNPVHGFLSMSNEVMHQAQTLQPNKPCIYVPHPMYDMFGSTLSKTDACKKLGLDDNADYLLFFGFIRAYKGLHLLLESFSKVNFDKYKLKLIIAGEFYEPAEPYLEQIKKLNLADKVILKTDFIPNHEVSAYFSASSLVVQTYLSATQSGVTQIAYYYDKPMLVTNVGGLSELVPNEKVGLVVEPNANMITQAIERFFYENLADDFKKNMPEIKQQFTWSYLSESLLNL